MESGKGNPLEDHQGPIPAPILDMSTMNKENIPNKGHEMETVVSIDGPGLQRATRQANSFQSKGPTQRNCLSPPTGSPCKTQNIEELGVMSNNTGIIRSSRPIGNNDQEHLNLLVWNVWGASNNNLLSVIKEHVRMQNPQIIALLETHVSGITTDEVCRKIGFQDHYRVEARGHQGEI
ncbi:hypothetical protein Cgig2_017462 [Carnegiea gigantea]|uniref:Uncharacterized protein n=1 Tax=Carnegiea gigantea TaxID=171969 RepID=A0A9Q1GWQ0_9CARY|nr:hypothetical protein Cgig2_017462 [Carnegiea gigantea]